jgi:hypothetical protein
VKTPLEVQRGFGELEEQTALVESYGMAAQ